MKEKWSQLYIFMLKQQFPSCFCLVFKQLLVRYYEYFYLSIINGDIDTFS